MRKLMFYAVLCVMYVASLSIAGSAWAQDCMIEPREGRIIIDFGLEIPGLCSPRLCIGGPGQADPVFVSPPIPAGIYDITLQSYDNHSIKPGQEQLNERYFLKLRNTSDVMIVMTNAMDDLPTADDNLIQLVNEDLYVGDDIGSLVAVHFCDDSTGNICDDTENSVVPVCVAFDPADEGPGVGTPGFWKNHPDMWPVEEITIGGITYGKEEAIFYMDESVSGDKTFTMFPALVAAKLNVLVGNDDSCIADTIAAADAWMATYPLGSGVSGSSNAWKMGEPLYEELDDYNNGFMCAPYRENGAYKIKEEKEKDK